MKNKFYKIILILFVLLAPIVFVYATDKSPCDPKTLCNPISETTLNGFIKTILIGVIKIGIPLIAIAIIYSGFLYVTAMGNEEKIGKAHQAILYTLVGAAILLGSWAIAILISDTVLAL